MATPETLPANFDQWDAPQAQPQPAQQPTQQTAAPDVLPANFNGWDGQQPQPAQQPSEDKGFLHGIFTNTIGPMWEAAKKEHEEAKTMTLTQRFKKGVEKGTLGNPAAQAYQVIAGMLSDAFEEGAKSVKHAKNATVDYGEAAKRLVHGDFKGAEQAGNAASEEVLSAQGHGLAAAVPYFGPAAARAGEKIGSGKPKEGAGEAVALLAQAAGPSLIKGASKTASATKSAAVNAFDKVNGSAGSKAIQQSLQTSVRESLAAVATDAGVTPQTGAQPRFRNVGRSVAEAVESKSEGLYHQIDEATAGRFTNAQREIKNVNRKLKEIAGTDDALEEKLFEKKLKLESDFEDLFEMAKREGVKPEVADAARSSWKQAQALKDLDQQIKASTAGDGKAMAETVDPNKLAPRLRKLFDVEGNRLAEALGSEEKAEALLTRVYEAIPEADAHASKVARRKHAAGYVTKGVLGGVGLGGAAFGVNHGLKALSGGE
jgi:hypothetical protein